MVKIAKSGLFLGEYRHRLDEKNRIALPKRLRVEIDGFEIVLAKGFEACIAGFAKDTWQEMAKEQLAMPFYDEVGRKLRRQLFSQAVILELDGQGRMVLPDHLLKIAELDKNMGQEIVVVGVGDHFELWQETNWKTYQESI